jgi:hypothetical protein
VVKVLHRLKSVPRACGLSIPQCPEAANAYTSIVSFDDSQPGGADRYRGLLAILPVEDRPRRERDEPATARHIATRGRLQSRIPVAAPE